MTQQMAQLIALAWTRLNTLQKNKIQVMQGKRNYFTTSALLLCITVICIVQACKKDEAPAPAAPSYSWVEEFDTLANALNRGWVVVNNSRPLGSSSWIQGEYFIDGKGGLGGYPAASYTYSGQDFIVCTYNANSGSGSISAWLVSPETSMKNGDEITFYTRTLAEPATYPDRMQVRLSSGSSVAVGSGPVADTSVGSATGNFSTLLLDINPTLALSGATAYPGTAWKQYTLTVSGLPPTIVKRRFAFRYFIPSDAGATGTNGQGIGLDKVAFISK
jgi:hypothetical protein